MFLVYKIIAFELGRNCGSIFAKVFLWMFGGFEVFVTISVVYKCVL